MKTAIEVKGLYKSYRKLQVLKGVDLEVESGSIFALLGSNGAGKTTIINILATLIKPDGGSASVCGYDVIKQGGKVRGCISLTGQSAAVDDILTGRENLRMIGKLRHLGSANEACDGLLEKFELKDAADRKAATYSGGMKRRLDLAMSLIGETPVVFLDEPTTGLDPQSRMAVWKMIRTLSASGTTVFLTTQYLEEADQLADTIAILHGGKIVAKGTPAELKKMLPPGSIELEFHSEEDLKAACGLLAGFGAETDEESETLVIPAGGGVKQAVGILNRLEEAGITVAGFSQKLPTLEDVFLAITKEKEDAV
jgi:ABC-2 type transport system ATP-binding protein